MTPSKEKMLIEIDRLKTFPDSFLEYFLNQEEVSDVTKVLIEDILEKRKGVNSKHV